MIGGGPAGATTALRLARFGHDVVLLDRAVHPRPKACGDCLSPQANLILEELGLLPAIHALPQRRLRGWRIFAHDGSSFSAHFDSVSKDPRLAHSLALERRHLDGLLLEAARAAGVRVMEQARLHAIDDACVVARTAERESRIGARIIVGADGLHSRTRRLLGLAGRSPRLRKTGFSAHLPLDDLSDCGQMHLARGACLGIAPVSDRLANLTLVLDSRRFGALLKGKDPRLLGDLLHHFPAAAHRFGKDAFRQAALLASGPYDWPTRGLITQRAALVGDAAGYYDPFTGQGIYQALLGARLLAGAVDDLLRRQNPHALRRYQRELGSLLRAARAVQHGVEYVCARPALAVASIRALNQAPAAAAALIGVTGDLRPPHTLLASAPITQFCFALLRRPS